MTDQRPQIDLEAVKDDVAYRTSVLVHLDYIRNDLAEVKQGLADHIEKDETRFGAVNQKIGENSGSISKGFGMVAGVVFMVGLIMWIIDKVLK